MCQDTVLNLNYAAFFLTRIVPAFVNGIKYLKIWLLTPRKCIIAVYTGNQIKCIKCALWAKCGFTLKQVVH
jgi:hypothetical protein